MLRIKMNMDDYVTANKTKLFYQYCVSLYVLYISFIVEAPYVRACSVCHVAYVRMFLVCSQAKLLTRFGRPTGPTATTY